MSLTFSNSLAKLSIFMSKVMAGGKFTGGSQSDFGINLIFCSLGTVGRKLKKYRIFWSLKNSHAARLNLVVGIGGLGVGINF